MSHKLVKTFEPEPSISECITTLVKQLAIHSAKVDVKYQTLYKIQMLVFEVEADNKFGSYLTTFLNSLGYSYQRNFKSDVHIALREKLSAKGADMLARLEKGLISASKDEIVREHTITYKKHVKYHNPSQWCILFSLPIAQIPFWYDAFLKHISVATIPPLSEEENLQHQKRLQIVNQKLDGKYIEPKKIYQPTKILRREV